MTKARTFLWLVSLIILTGLAWTFFMFQEGYEHERPEEDCSEAYDYPICKRAVVPYEQQPPSTATVFLTIIAVFIFGLILTIISFKASIFGQEEIAAPGKETASGPTSTSAHGSFQSGKTPTTIEDNDIPEEAVKRG